MSKQTFTATVVSVFEDEETETFGVSFGELDTDVCPLLIIEAT